MSQDPAFNQTRKIISNAHDICMRNIDNQPLAKKECFPTLTGQVILMELEKVSDDYVGLRLEGRAGASNNMIWCEPDAAAAKKIRDEPASIKVGAKYFVKGDFTNFTAGGILDFYTFTNCQFSMQAEKK
jgi:hypothetical protein